MSDYDKQNNIFKHLECNEIPTITNAPSYNITYQNQRRGVYLNSTEVEYKCTENFVPKKSKMTCIENGEWTPTFECYPGF